MPVFPWVLSSFPGALCYFVPSVFPVTFSSYSSLAFSVSGHSLPVLASDCLSQLHLFLMGLPSISGYTALSASIYRSHGFSARMSWESSLSCLSLSQVMRRSHEAREKLLRLGIFRQVDVLIDTCHGRCHGGVSL